MSKTLRVVNWSTWQSFRADRGAPPWIKVHRNLMTNVEWASLSDAEKGQLVSIWLVAADKGGAITSDATLLRKFCQLDKSPNISKFIDLGFLRHDDATVTPPRRHDDAPDEIREEQIREEFAQFEDWYKHYPKKRDKQKAKKAWDKLKVSEELLSSMLSSLEKQKQSNDWKKDNGQFIPYPTTYLNGSRWEDELDATQGESEWY